MARVCTNGFRARLVLGALCEKDRIFELEPLLAPFEPESLENNWIS